MSNTVQTILELLKRGPASPKDLAKKLGISRQALHRHLKPLNEHKQIEKIGLGPHIEYCLPKSPTESKVIESFIICETELLPAYLKKFSKRHEMDFKAHSNGEKKGGQLPELGFMVEASAVYSSNIEGNSMNLDSFLNSRMSPARFRPKEAQEIEDLVKAYLYCADAKLSEDNMLKAHGMLSKHFVSMARQGRYRQEPVGVFSRNGLEYMAIESHLIQGEMKLYFKKVDELLASELNITEIIFWASWIHLTMALVHPFADGNGRIARLCEKWFLVKKWGNAMLTLPSEEYYYKNRPDYYAALRLGINYWETDFEKALPFFELLSNTPRLQPDGLK